MDKIMNRVSIDNTTHCWNWTGPVDKHGYGIIYYLGVNNYFTHRYSFEEWYGVDPKGKAVCHKCDNPKCVNPDHLFLGTQRDNLKDMRAKNRGSYGGLRNNIGEYNPAAKLSDKQVAEIFELRAATKITQQQLADKYGVSNACICLLLQGKRRKIATPSVNILTTKNQNKPITLSL